MVGRGIAAAITSLFAQIGGLMLGLTQTPMLNAKWCESIVSAAGQLPVVGPYLAKIPLELFSMILGFIILWCVGYCLLTWLSGSLGFIVALVAGALLVAYLYGGISFNIPFKLPIG